MASNTESADLALTVDIGGSKIAVALVGTEGQLIAQDWIVTRRPGPGPTAAQEVWADLAALIERVASTAHGRPIVGIGAASAGPFDLAAATISPVNIPSWRRFPLVERLGAQIPGVPVRLVGDGICAAIGEHWRGAGRDRDDLLVLVVSTGVGGGIIHDGRPFTGATGNAGHVGHMIVDLDGDECPCGARGCVESIASGPSMVRRAKRDGWQPTGDGSAKELAEAARWGDAIAEAAFARAGNALAAGIVSAAAMCDLTSVVIGGGLANAADLLLPPLRRGLADFGRLGFLQHIDVRVGELGGAAGLIGAAALIHRPKTYWLNSYE